jgi:hypothetical protein
MTSRIESFTCLQAGIESAGNAIKNGSNCENSIRIDCVYAEADL